MEKSTFILTLTLLGFCQAGTMQRPKALTVNCQSMGDSASFQNRLMVRTNAEDQTTIWLLKGEQLSINFELDRAATVELLDLRYSNDGEWDHIEISLDEIILGDFKTPRRYAWGQSWNDFKSSGPLGGPHELPAGKHALTIKIADADVYGVELDYIRLNVHGTVLNHLSKQFICVHKPGTI